jgi:membrane protein YdbS with pleckstrin-like domain
MGITSRFRRKPKHPKKPHQTQAVHQPQQPDPKQPVPDSQPVQQPQPVQPVQQQPQPQQQPKPQAPPIQKPQPPGPPVAPKAPPGKIQTEKKLMKLSRARRAQFLKYAIGMIILVAGAYVYLFRPPQLNILGSGSMDYIAIAFAFIGIIIILYAEARRRGAHYYVTQYRVVEEWGILSKKQHAIQLSEIESVKTNQSILDRILGIGDVETKTSRDTLIMKKVGNPSKAEALLLAEMGRTRGGQPIQPREI